VEPEPGSRVTVDGLDVLAMGLDDLRSRVSIIPQDPVRPLAGAPRTVTNAVPSKGAA
jgi:ABC-type transport system involved in Fe-S cluster assembly fused permease/ATPase subunit